MNELLDQAFTMPTTVFSVLLILVVLYWLVKILTGLDVFDGLFEGAEAAAEGAFDGALDGALDGGLEAGDAFDSAGEIESGHGRGWVRMLGLGELPVILVLSLIVVFGWAFSYGGTALASKVAMFAAGGFGVVLMIAFGAIALAVVMTMVAVTPLRRMMRFAPATERRQLVGRTARVTTQRIDEGFGQAEVTDLGGAPILIQARARVPNGMKRGDLVKVAAYDPRREVFGVVPSD